MSPSIPILLCAALVVGSPKPAPAQTVSPSPPPSTPASTRNENGEVVTLEEFSVSTSPANDYLSAESITGTRVVSKLRDLPFNVSVVTSDFIEDFAAFELKDQFAYVSSFSPSEAQGEYQLRGFVSSNQLRNGFRRLGLIDKVNVDRAEVIKGAAASIYGKIQPGGVINIITKKPRSTPQQSLSFAAGTQDFWRAQGSSTGPIGRSKTFFYRQDLAATGRKYEMPFKENDQWTTSTQLLWKPADHTSLSFELEYLWRHERRGNAVPPYIVLNVPDPFRVASQNRTYNRWARLATELAHFNHQGPQEYNNREVFTLTGTFEHRINAHWSARVGANWFDRSFDRINVSGDAFRPEFNAIANGSTANPGPRIPVWRPIDEGSSSVQADLLGSFFTGPFAHKLLFTLDYNRTTEDAYEARMTAATAARPGMISPRLSVSHPDYAFVSFIDDRTLYTDERENLRSTVDNWGLFVSERVAVFEGRLVALAGLRFDTVANNVHDRLARQKLEYRLDDTTYQFGLNFRVTKEVTLFANTSTTFLPQARFNIDGAPLPNETGEGSEGGIKIVAFHDRFALTATYFDISRGNIARETSDPVTGDRVVILSGRESARGFEIDANAQLTAAFQFLGGYGYADAITASNDEFPFLINTTPRRVPRHTFGAAARYELQQGPLKGLYFTLGTQYASSSVVNPGSGRTLTASATNPIVNNPMANGRLPFPERPAGAVITVGAVRVGDGREALKNTAYQICDASVGYRWRSGQRKFAQKVQLNAKNLTDKFYTWGSAAQGDPFTLIGTYSLTF